MRMSVVPGRPRGCVTLPDRGSFPPPLLPDSPRRAVLGRLHNCDRLGHGFDQNIHCQRGWWLYGV